MARKEAKGQSAIKEAAAAARHLCALAFLHDTKKALAAYRKAVELDPQDPTGWNRLGHLLRRVGELDEAEQAYETVLALGKRTESREAIAIAYGNLGIVYETRGELDRAEEMHLKGLEIDEALGRKEGMASTYGNLGIVYKKRGELDRAEEMYLKSLEIEEALGRKEGMARQYGNLGILYEARQEMRAACRAWEKSTDLFAEFGVPHMVKRVEVLMSAAACP